MKNPKYRERLVDKEIDASLGSYSAVCIEGPAHCGRTWTAEHHAGSEVLLRNSSGKNQNRRLAEISPHLVLQGAEPRLVDEWQEVPGIWDAVCDRIEKVGRKGQFLLTESYATGNNEMPCGSESFARICMHTMSLYEAGFSDGSVSLRDICTGKAPDIMTGEVNLLDLIEYVLRGGWPENICVPPESAMQTVRHFVNAFLMEASGFGGIHRDAWRMHRVLFSLARFEGIAVSEKAILRDIRNHDGIDITPQTLSRYLDVFRRLFLLSDLPACPASMRSTVRILQQPKHHFCDPSIAASLLGFTPDTLLGNLSALERLSASLVERDLLIYADTFGGKLFHYQDYRRRKIDAVVVLPDGNWCGFDIRLGAGDIDAAAQELLRVQREFGADPKARKPQALCVVCGMSKAAYHRPDGVYVVPVTALKN